MQPRIRWICGILLLWILLIGSVTGMRNPAAVYCSALGYQYQVVTEADGGERGYCQITRGPALDAWQFLEGNVGMEYSYCSHLGYATRHLNDWQLCERFGTGSCSACVLEDGTVVEVTRLMHLDLNESRCGDGVCGFPENAEVCPQDCPRSGPDGLCDALRDGICDRDCTVGEDPDCSTAASPAGDMTKAPLEQLLVPIALLILVGYHGMKRWR